MRTLTLVSAGFARPGREESLRREAADECLGALPYARSRMVVVPVLPSDSDHGVTAIREAMAMDRPVVCPRTKGQLGVLVDGETGIFVPPGDPRRLGEAIRFLWTHPEVAERMGRAGPRRVEASHTFEQFIDRVKTTVEATIEGHRGRFPVPAPAPDPAGT